MTVRSASGACLAHISGALRHKAESSGEFPAIGDWVAFSGDVIHALYKRKSRFARKAAGTANGEQVVATNIDTVFLVTGLDGDFNLRRLERYLVLGWQSGAPPVVLLNKADLSEEADGLVEQVLAIAPGAPVHAISAASGQGLDDLVPYLRPGRTIALLGSSGVGKSTLLNAPMERVSNFIDGGPDRLGIGPLARTGPVRESDSRGRHTTTHRELFRLPSGALIIDTPGMRELGLADGDGLAGTFEDISALGGACHFGDCRHENEPGCAVQAGLAEGTLAPERLTSYIKLRKEQEHAATRTDLRLRRQEKQRWKKIHMEHRRSYK